MCETETIPGFLTQMIMWHSARGPFGTTAKHKRNS